VGLINSWRRMGTTPTRPQREIQLPDFTNIKPIFGQPPWVIRPARGGRQRRPRERSTPATRRWASTPAAVPAPTSAATGGATDVIVQLERLGALRDSGVLTEAEFAAQKARIFG